MSGREKLLEAAGSLFSTLGYAEVGVAQIIERAGVQAPTLYHHFKDKEGLFTTWADVTLKRVGSAISNAVKPEDPVRQGLESYAHAFLHEVDFDIRQVLHDSESLARGESREKILMAYYECLYEPLCTLLVKGMSAQVIRQENVGRMADVFLGGLQALRKPRGQSMNGEPARWWADNFAKAFSR